MLDIQVTIRLFTTLRELAGKREETLDVKDQSATVKVALEKLIERYGREFREYLYGEGDEIQSYLQLLVNGKSINLMEQMDTLLKEGDQLAIIPPVGGGRPT